MKTNIEKIQIDDLYDQVIRLVSFKLGVVDYEIKRIEDLILEIKTIDFELYKRLHQFLYDYEKCILDWNPKNIIERIESKKRLMEKIDKQ